MIDLILEHAKFTEVPFAFQATDEAAVDQAAGGEQADIPAAKYDDGEKVPEARREGLGARDEGRGTRE